MTDAELDAIIDAMVPALGLRVQPDWSAANLVQRLQWATDSPENLGRASNALDRLVPEQPSKALRTATGLLLNGRGRADVWLAGSRLAENWTLDVRARIDSGEFWIVQEDGFGGRQWRFGGKGTMLYFQDRLPGVAPVTLVRMPRQVPLQGWHDFHLARRGPGLWACVDGQPASTLPFTLPGPWQGTLGILTAGMDGPAKVEVTRMQFRPLAYLARSLSPAPSTEETQAVTREPALTAALSPRWRVRDHDRLQEQGLNADLFRMLARRYAWDILPEVALLDRERPDQAQWLLDCADQVAAMGWNGFQLNVGHLAPEDRVAWEPACLPLAERLKHRGLRLVLVPARQGVAR